jgi:hypothetical protein
MTMKGRAEILSTTSSMFFVAFALNAMVINVGILKITITHQVSLTNPRVELLNRLIKPHKTSYIFYTLQDYVDF